VDPQASVGDDPGARTPACDPDLDVRDLPPARRHESIFAAYLALAPGAGFVLVNDHDPKPLRYQFQAEQAGQFTWDYLESGPQTWRVRIGRPRAVTRSGTSETGGAEPDGEDGGGQEPELDVRQLPHWQRHDAILTAYRALQRALLAASSARSHPTCRHHSDTADVTHMSST